MPKKTNKETTDRIRRVVADAIFDRQVTHPNSLIPTDAEIDHLITATMNANRGSSWENFVDAQADLINALLVRLYSELQ